MSPIIGAQFPYREDYDKKTRRDQRIRPLRDNLKDLKVEAPEFDGNLNPRSHLDFVQSRKKIIELKYYNDDKSFKMVILKMKGYAFL